MSAAPEPPATPAPRPSPPRGSLFVRALHWLLRLGVGLVILLLFAAAYLQIVGFPAYVTVRVENLLARNGLFCRFDRLSLNLLRGFVAEGIALYESPAAAAPLLEAASADVAVAPRSLFPGPPHRAMATLRDARIVLSARADDAALGEESRRIDVTGLSFCVIYEAPAIRLRDFSAKLFGVTLSAHGVVYGLPEFGDDDGDPDDGPIDLAALLAPLKSLPREAEKAIEILQGMRFSGNPVLRVAFAVFAKDLSQVRCAVEFESGGACRIDGGDFENVRFAVGCTPDEGIRIREAELVRGGESMRLAGAWKGGLVRGELVSAFPLEGFLPFLPEDEAALVRREVVPCDFPWRIRVAVPEVDAATFLAALRGDEEAAEKVPALEIEFSARDVTVHGFPVSKVSARVAYDARRAEIKSLSVVGGARGETTLTLRSGAADWEAGRVDVVVAATGHAEDAAPFLTEEENEYLAWFRTLVPVRTDNFHFWAKWKGGFDFGFDADVEAGGVDVNSVRFDRAETHLELADTSIRFTGVDVERPEGRVTGSVVIDWARDTVFFDAESTISPRASFEMLGEDIAEFMGFLTLDGPTAVRAFGILDYGNFSLNDLKLHVTGTDGAYGWGPWCADAVDFDMSVEGLRLGFSNATGRAFGGELKAVAALYPAGPAGDWRYAVEASLADASFPHVLAAAVNTSAALEGKPMEDFSTNATFQSLGGRIRGGARMEGAIGGAGVVRDQRGRGRAEISAGRFFQMKFFGGMGEILAAILPSFSTLAEADVSGDFTIEDGRLDLSDGLMAGKLFSVSGNGTVSLEDLSVEASARVKPMRTGVFSRLVRILTSPLTKLLEIGVSGTLENPKWDAKNMSLKKLVTNPLSVVTGTAGLITDAAETLVGAENAPRRFRPPMPERTAPEGE